MADKPRTDCDVFLIVNADGEYAVSDDEDHVGERFNDYYDATGTTRRYHLTVSVPTPSAVTARVIVPDDIEDGQELQVTVS